MNQVTDEEKRIIKIYKNKEKDNDIIPFELFGWVECITRTAYDWVYNNIFNNVHVEKDGDFSQINNIEHTDAMPIGTNDRFTYDDPSGFLENINNHYKYPKKNKLIFIPQTGHTYQRKEQEVAYTLLDLINEWNNIKE